MLLLCPVPRFLLFPLPRPHIVTAAPAANSARVAVIALAAMNSPAFLTAPTGHALAVSTFAASATVPAAHALTRTKLWGFYCSCCCYYFGAVRC